MDASGILFRDSTGAQKDLLTILAGKGINSIRLRVSGGSRRRVLQQGRCGEDGRAGPPGGISVMIDFHYSGSWADPGKQTKPAAWANDSTAQLVQALAAHTTDVLTALRDSGVTPEWVQVGNEVNDGMLWEDGRASTNPANFAAMVSAGAAAAKGVDPNAIVIVHISNGYDNALFRWMFDLLKANHATWDAIGMSLYPSPRLAQRRQSLPGQHAGHGSRYGSKVLISKVGMSWDQPEHRLRHARIADREHEIGDRGPGCLLWEPEAYNGWQGYTLGAFDNSGKPTKALDAFLTGGPASVAKPHLEAGPGDLTWRIAPSGVLLHSSLPVDWRVLDLGGRVLDRGRASGDALVARNLPEGEWVLSLQTAAGLDPCSSHAPERHRWRQRAVSITQGCASPGLVVSGTAFQWNEKPFPTPVEELGNHRSRSLPELTRGGGRCGPLKSAIRFSGKVAVPWKTCNWSNPAAVWKVSKSKRMRWPGGTWMVHLQSHSWA